METLNAYVPLAKPDDSPDTKGEEVMGPQEIQKTFSGICKTRVGDFLWQITIKPLFGRIVLLFPINLNSSKISHDQTLRLKVFSRCFILPLLP